MTTLSVDHIYKKFQREEVLSGIGFLAESGDLVGIIGPNGSGKTTLLRILAGVAVPDSGSVQLNGHSVGEKGYFARHVGYVPQDNPLFDNLTVKDNLRLWYSDTARDWRKDAADGLIARFGVNEYLNKRVSALSGGMKKRLSLVCALAKDPELLILDEPGASLDREAKEDICRYMTEFAAGGGIVLLASHEVGELAVTTRTVDLNPKEPS